jgi:choline-sulfatase
MKTNLKKFLLGVSTIATVEAYSDTKPNVLFIFADDQCFETLGSLNNNEIKTPNLDRLRRNGVTFTHTFNQGSWCPAVSVASRTMLNTGKFVWKAATHSKNGNMKKNVNTPDKMLNYQIPFVQKKGYWSEYMREAGYETYFAGKWHVREANIKKVFDHVGTVRGGMPNQTKERYKRKFIEGEPDTWTPYDKTKNGFWKGGKHWSEVLGDEGIGFIEQAKTKQNPFFMYLAFNAPHDPRQSPKKYVDMYPLDKISVPKNFIPEYPYNEEAGSGRRLRDERLAPFPRTEYSIKVNRQEYYAIITHMDHQIGRILDALEKSGKAENTYIIFTADHGLAVGDHGFVGKQNMYDRSVRVPMIITGPKIPKNYQNHNFAYLQDAMATALDIADSKHISEVDFKSLIPMCEDQNVKSYQDIYSCYMTNQRMYRDENYKMIIYPTANVVRLYDMKNDPHEMNDLASDKAYKNVLGKLFEKFKQKQKVVGDPIDVTRYFEKFVEKL